MDLPDFTLRTALSNEDSLFRTADYKAGVLAERQDAGLEIFRAYGNADTDIEAYERVGIPKNHTFTIGDLAGESGTTPIEQEHYFGHIDAVVEDTPGSGCRWVPHFLRVLSTNFALWYRGPKHQPPNPVPSRFTMVSLNRRRAYDC